MPLSRTLYWSPKNWAQDMRGGVWLGGKLPYREVESDSGAFWGNLRLTVPPSLCASAWVDDWASGKRWMGEAWAKPSTDLCATQWHESLSQTGTATALASYPGFVHCEPWESHAARGPSGPNSYISQPEWKANTAFRETGLKMWLLQSLASWSAESLHSL